MAIDANEISRTLYLGGEGRTYKEMLACGLWLEKNWERWHTGKVSKDEKCEDFSTASLVILRITKGRIVLGENYYYIDYTSKSNIVPPGK